MHFGEHVTIDGYNGDFKTLNSKKVVFDVLNELVEKLGMTKMAGPYVVKAKGNTKKDPGGWSGFVLIEESHISIHTFPKRGFISADVYTCQNGLNVKFIVDYFKNKFGLKSVEKHFIKRGLKYPEQNIC